MFIGRRMDKEICTYNETTSSLKKKEIAQYVTTWMNLENIILSEIKQSQKDKYCMIPLTRGKIVKFLESENKVLAAGGRRMGKQRVTNPLA